MPEPLKNLFNRPYFESLADSIRFVYPDFDRSSFLKSVFDQSWDALALKERMHHATRCLHQYLPHAYPDAIIILKKSITRLEHHGFADMVFSDYVAIYGLQHWDISIPALEFFTQYMSAEFAVRHFLLKDLERMMAQMLVWAKHDSHHVRRLATEGCRPRLPWGLSVPALKKDPSPIIPVLEILKNDPNDNVRHCVANNLNDISRDHPPITLKIIKQWLDEDIQDFDYIRRRALRTLIKQGHPDALALLGFSANPDIQISDLTGLPEEIRVGQKFYFSFTITSTSDRPQDLMIDYIIHHQRANGQLIPKVFKLSMKTIKPSASLNIKKQHSFQEVTTRRYYPGIHKLEIQINGKNFIQKEFILNDK